MEEKKRGAAVRVCVCARGEEGRPWTPRRQQPPGSEGCGRRAGLPSQETASLGSARLGAPSPFSLSALGCVRRGEAEIPSPTPGLGTMLPEEKCSQPPPPPPAPHLPPSRGANPLHHRAASPSPPHTAAAAAAAGNGRRAMGAPVPFASAVTPRAAAANRIFVSAWNLPCSAARSAPSPARSTRPSCYFLGTRIGFYENRKSARGAP